MNVSIQMSNAAQGHGVKLVARIEDMVYWLQLQDAMNQKAELGYRQEIVECMTHESELCVFCMGIQE